MTPHECLECGSPIVDGYCSADQCECSAKSKGGPKCNGCGMQLLKKNAWMDDGCPCNTPFGVNDGNQTISQWRRELQQEAMHENERLKLAIRTHRSQKADDRCIEDDDRLYEALGDGIKCDRRVGDQCAMLENCKRFIANRTEGGGWPSYAELEAKNEELRAALLPFAAAAGRPGRLVYGVHDDPMPDDAIAGIGVKVSAWKRAAELTTAE